MALFKPFHGTEAELNAVTTLHDGYCYFTTDKNNMYIDTSASGTLQRYQVNAYAAEVLRNSDGTTEIDVDDILLKTAVMDVAQGGTGASTLTLNALLVGNGTNAIKMIPITAGGIVVGDSDNGVTALTGTGALYALSSGTPLFGTLPLAAGGTGATTAAAARANLEVYSTDEVDTNATSVAYTTTLYASGWVSSSGSYTYTYSNTALTCGKDGSVPPIITYTSNQDEYSKITSAEATAGTGIVFTASELISNDIGIIIIDVK